jgi:hypothetical protein
MLRNPSNGTLLAWARDRLLVDRDAGKQPAAFDTKIDHAAVGVEAGDVVALRSRPIANAQVEVGGRGFDANSSPAELLEKIRVAQIYAVEGADIDKKSVALEFEEQCKQAIFPNWLKYCGISADVRVRARRSSLLATDYAPADASGNRAVRGTERAPLVRGFKGHYKGP